MKKLIATILVTGLFTFGCDRCPDVPHFFDIQDVQVSNVSLDPALNASQGNLVYDSVKFEHFAINGSYQVIYHAANKPFSFSLLPKAYALDCVEPGQGGTKEKIEKMEVIALSDFDAGFKSGASLNSIVKVNGLPVAQYIENQNANSIDSFGFEISFTQKPDSTVKQAFRVVYKLTNGETYSPETTPIRIY